MIIKTYSKRFILFLITTFVSLNCKEIIFKHTFLIPSNKDIMDIKNAKYLKTKKKKILIYTCRGGGGHMAVSRAVTDYLKDQYDIVAVNMFGEILAPIDYLGFATAGKFTGEDFYNFCLQSRWNSIVARYLDLGSWMFRCKEHAIEKLIREYTITQKPDLLLSVIPIVDFAIIKVAKSLNLPLIVLTNDLDTTNYINGLKSPRYNKFYYTLAFDDQDMRNKIAAADIPEKQIKIVGFPLRPEFFKQKDKDVIKQEFLIPENKQVVMLLMGGAGSIANYRYVKTLSKSNLPMHIIACLGRSENLRPMIEKIKLPDHISISILGFTSRIADLMAISDVLITKPGPGSVCEAIASKLPIIIDKTSGTLWWELMNIDLVQKYGFGDVLHKFKDLNGMLEKFLNNPEYITQIKNSMSLFTKDSFEKNFKELIANVLLESNMAKNINSFEISLAQKLF